jgi:vanillate O-demethylase monooxygenase subunit
VSGLTNVDPALRACWHPVAPVGEVGADPVQVWLLGEPWALFRTGGSVHALPDRCPHRLAPLSAGRIVDGTLQCGYHGWRFAGDGRCCEIPALGPGAALPPRAAVAPAAGVTERYGLVWLAPEPPVCELPDVPEWDDPAFQVAPLTPQHVRAAAGLLADNFLDMAHFPFVHRGTIGAHDETEVDDYSVDRDGLSFEVVITHPFSNPEDPGVASGARPLIQTRTMRYVYTAPFAMRLRLDYHEAGGTNTITLFVQPETLDSCRVYMTVLRNDLGGDAGRLADAVAYEQRVFDEDLVVQGRYTTRELPLDLTAEVHTRADRITVELRRVLADLVAVTTSRATPSR